MSRFLKQLFFLAVPKRRLGSDEASILMYHSVSDRDDYFSSVTPAAFAQQLHFLAARHIPVISLKELVTRLAQNKPLGGAVALTFDDGYEDNYTAAFPLLKQYGFPATVFVTTDLIGKEDKRGLRHLSEPQMREMGESKLVRFAPHTRTHPRLSSLRIAEAREEVLGSLKAIERVCGKPSLLFAYPYGDFNPETKELVRELGFTAACAVYEGLVVPTSDPFALPRNSIDRSTSFSQFRGKCSKMLPWYLRVKSAL